MKIYHKFQKEKHTTKQQTEKQQMTPFTYLSQNI